MCCRILKYIGKFGRVDVSKACHTAGEVRRIVVCTEHTAKLLITQTLQVASAINKKSIRVYLCLRHNKSLNHCIYKNHFPLMTTMCLL